MKLIRGNAGSPNTVSDKTVNLVIDQGNTICKIAVFDKSGALICSETINVLTREYIAELLAKHSSITSAIYSSVGPAESRATDWLSNLVSEVMELHSDTPVPLGIEYDRRTLGSDRLAVVVGARQRLIDPKTSALVIDAGTAITYERLNSLGVYIGGNIAPGVFLRLRGLHQFTSRLPLINDLPEELLPMDNFGRNTTEAMLQGVLTGLTYEIEGYIARIRKQDSDATVFLTGGDANLVFNRLQEDVILAPDLVLEGLNHILEYNKKVC